MISLMTDWLQNQGGLAAIEQHNQQKAQLLYHAIDNSDYFDCPVNTKDRSLMNVVFTTKSNNQEKEQDFIKQAQAAGIVGIKGHRSVGGFRASIYNSQTEENIKQLIKFMQEFEIKNHKKTMSIA